MFIEKRIARRVINVICVLACFVLQNVAHARTVVIVARGNPITALRSDQLAGIFLGQVGNFPGGAPAIPVDVHDGDPIREEFYATTLGKTMPQLRAYWAKQVFTGKGRPPLELANSEAVKKLIASHPQYIGYVDERVVDSTVKTIAVEKGAAK
jgi:ABC-type phosphate transport system substrate-binding protein